MSEFTPERINEILTPEMINEIVAAVKAASSGGRTRKGRGFKRSKTTPEESNLRKIANDKECIRVFTAAGYKDVRPRINVLTYGKIKPDGTKTGWLAQGRQVRKGQKGLAVGPFNLFHVDQTEPITATPTSIVGTITDPKAAAPKAEVKAEPPKTEAKSASASWTDWNS